MYQQVIFAIAIFTIITLGSNSFANSGKHSGVCELWVKDGKWKEAGAAYITSIETGSYYGLKLNDKRRVFASLHQLFDQDKEIPKLVKDKQHQSMPFRETKIKCDQDEYEVRFIPLNHKRFSYFDLDDVNSKFCNMDKSLKDDTKLSPKLIKRGCDTAIFDIILKTGDKEKLERIKGFSPLVNRETREGFKNRHVYLGVNQTDILTGRENFDCIIEKSYINYFTLKCSNLTKEFVCNNKSLRVNMNNRNLYSGTPVLLAEKNNPKNIQISNNNNPLAIGSIVNFSCNIDGSISVGVDSLELSNEANQILGEEITHIEHND
ncbi:hypothetical protein [Nitrosomonas sp. wSCUT-2]